MLSLPWPTTCRQAAHRVAAGKSSRIDPSQEGLSNNILGLRSFENLRTQKGGKRPLVWTGRVDDAANMLLACLPRPSVSLRPRFTLRRQIVRYLTNEYDTECRALPSSRDLPRKMTSRKSSGNGSPKNPSCKKAVGPQNDFACRRSASRRPRYWTKQWQSPGKSNYGWSWWWWPRRQAHPRCICIKSGTAVQRQQCGLLIPDKTLSLQSAPATGKTMCTATITLNPNPNNKQHSWPGQHCHDRTATSTAELC